MRARGSFLSISAILAVASPCARADGPYVSVSESVTWQDNMTNAPAGDGIRSAFGVESGATMTWLHSVDFSTMLTSGVAIDASACPSYGGLDSLSVGPAVELRHKLGLGALAPVLYAGLSGCATGYLDPERSNLEGDLVFGLSKRLREDVQVVLDGRLGSYDAKDIVFSGNFASLGTTLNWDVNDTWRIKLTAGWRSGDTVANYAAVQSSYGWVSPDPITMYLPGAWHYVGTFHEPYVAWRESARTWSYGAGISPALGRHTSVAFQFVHFESDSYGRYTDNVASVSLVHHF